MNILIEVENSISICSINGRDYPIARVDDDYVAITAASEKLADNITLMTNGEKNKTSSKYSPYEIWVPKDKFDKIITAKSWCEISDRL